MRAVLEELLTCTRNLHSTLLAEREALSGHNLNSLNAHTEAKKDLLIRIEALEVQRRQLLNTPGFDPAQSAIIPELESLWDAVLAELRRCQEENEVNGAIVRTHQTHTQRALDLLAGREGGQSVYQADGLPSVRSTSGEIAKA